MLALLGPPVCPDVWEHPRLLRVLVHLWFSLIQRWQELWRCVCVWVCACMGVSVFNHVYMSVQAAVCFWELGAASICFSITLMYAWTIQIPWTRGYQSWPMYGISRRMAYYCFILYVPCLWSESVIGLITLSCLHRSMETLWWGFDSNEL